MKESSWILALVAVLATSSAQDTLDILDAACLADVLNLANKLTNQNQTFTPEDTALFMFSGKRMFDLGSKEMCALTPNVTFKVISATIPQYNLATYQGLCIYEECRASFLNDLKPYIQPFIGNSSSIAYLLANGVLVHDEQDLQDMRDRQYTGFTLVTHLLYLLLAVGFIGIAVEFSKCLDKPGDQLNRIGVPPEPNHRKDKDIIKSKTKWGLFFLSFSFTRNMRKLTTVSGGGGGGGGEGFDSNLEVFAGVRAMSMMYVILGHVSSTMLQGVNIADLAQLMKSTFYTFVQGGFYAVDAFFCMAGFLGTYVLLGKLEKSKGKINIPLAYFHRWYRLAPALALVILLFQFVVPFVVHGPMAFGFATQLPACEKYWWSALLFINNLYPWDMDKQCVGWVWYLANDFQFFLLTPFILFIMYFNKIIGFVVNLMIICLSIMAGMLVTWNDNFLSPSLDQNFMTLYYEKPWCRMASYMVGVLLAQLYYDRKLALKGDPRGKGTLGNGCFSCYKQSSLLSWGSALLGVALTSFCIFIFDTAIKGTYGSWGIGVSMAYNGFARPLFVFGMMLVLFPTFEGRLSWFKAFMMNPLFVVLGRLTYCAYLCHFLVIYSYIYSLDSSRYFTETDSIYHYIGIYVFSYGVALGVSLVMEAPFLTIEKTILFPPKPPKQPKSALKDKTGEQVKSVVSDDTEAGRLHKINSEFSGSAKRTLPLLENDLT